MVYDWHLSLKKKKRPTLFCMSSLHDAIILFVSHASPGEPGITTKFLLSNEMIIICPLEEQMKIKTTADRGTDIWGTTIKAENKEVFCHATCSHQEFFRITSIVRLDIHLLQVSDDD